MCFWKNFGDFDARYYWIRKRDLLWGVWKSDSFYLFFSQICLYPTLSHIILYNKKRPGSTGLFFLMQITFGYSCVHSTVWDIVSPSKVVVCDEFMSEHLPFSMVTIVVVTIGLSSGNDCVVTQWHVFLHPAKRNTQATALNKRTFFIIVEK